MALTALKVKSLGPGRHTDAHGLHLYVRENGSRTWVLRLGHNGRRRDYCLGPAYDISLAEARALAADIRKKVRGGVDPVRERAVVQERPPTPRHSGAGCGGFEGAKCHERQNRLLSPEHLCRGHEPRRRRAGERTAAVGPAMGQRHLRLHHAAQCGQRPELFGDQRPQARIFKIVLYGSYARGDWVDDPIGGYHSDYDILIVVSHDKLTDVVDYWSAAEDRLMRELTIAKAISAPVSFIVHTLKDVNRQLDHGRPFFVDIVRQGIALYDAEGFCFHSPRELPPEEARAEAQTYFDEWFSTASEFLAGAEFHRARGGTKLAAFNYHQAVERFYHCTLLTLTLYSPKSHKLNLLRSHAEEVAPELIAAWPRVDKASRRCFELLRQAYVNARYSPHYRISGDELRWLGDRVADLQSLVKTVCERRLSTEN